MHVDVDHAQHLACHAIIPLKLGVLQRSADALTIVTLEGIHARRSFPEVKKFSAPAIRRRTTRGHNDEHLVLSRDLVSDERITLSKIGFFDAP